MIFFYNLVWFAIFPFVLIFFPLFSFLKGKKRSGLLQNFGVIRVDSDKLKNKKIIWLQALSVGEIATAIPVINELKSGVIKDLGYVVSVTTEAGYERAKKSFPDALKIFYTPFDFYPSIAGLIEKIKPVAILVIETGIWPNLIYCGKKNGAAAILVNGRISEKSFKSYKLMAPVAGRLFSMFHTLAARDSRVAEMFSKLNVDKKKIICPGDIKYDTLPTISPGEKEEYRKLFSMGSDKKIIMAGNTHEGEEEFMLDVFEKLKINFKNILLIIAPRRLERVPGIEKTLQNKGIAFEKRSELGPSRPRRDDVVLLDTIGELSRVYFVCDIIFVGKSIFPPGGGHSLLEPVAAGKIAFHGPYVQYYEEARGLLKKEGLAVELREKEEFIDNFSRILSNTGEDVDFLKKTAKFMKQRKGASKKIAEVVKSGIQGAAA